MDLFRRLFTAFNCHITTAFGQEEHYQNVNLLEAERIPFRTSTGRKFDFYSSMSANDFTSDTSVPFHLYVQKEDVKRACDALATRAENRVSPSD